MSYAKNTRKAGLAAALVAVGALGLTAAVTLAGFTATVTSPVNSYSSGTLLLSAQTNADTSCLSSGNTAGGITTNLNSTCLSNNLGGATSPGAAPGGTPTSNTVVLTNTGSLTAVAGLSLTVGGCTVSGNPVGSGANAASTGSDTAGFCGKVDVQIEDDTVAGTPSCLYGGTVGSACPATMSNTYNLSSLATAGSLGLKTNFAPGLPNARHLKILVGLDTSAGNPDQGLTATLPMTWNLAQ